MLLFSGTENDPQGLPASVYDINVEVEGRRFDNSQQRVTVRENKRANIVLDEIPDKRRIELVSDIDKESAAVMDSAQSQIDGTSLQAWLKSTAPRVTARHAC